MAKKPTDDGQKHLKIVTTIDENPNQEHKAPSGQVLLFGVHKTLVPEGFEDFAALMNNRLSRTEQTLDKTAKALTASSEQNRRLANSLETIIPKFIDQSVNSEKPDLVLAALKEGQEADVAIVDSMKVSSEALYTLSTGEIAERLGNSQMTPTRMGMIIRDLGLFENPKFHCTFNTSKNASCQKYKPSIIEEIYKRLSNPSMYDLNPEKVSKAAHYIRPKGSVIS